MGLAKSLEVSQGDKVKDEVYAKYRNLTSNPNNTSFLAALASVFNVSPSSVGPELSLYNSLADFAALVPNGNHDQDDEGAPKAFVTILLVDRNYNLVDAAWDQIDAAAHVPNGSAAKSPPNHDLMMKEITVKEPGYAYVFLSNEHYNYVEVFYDDFTLTHTQSPIVAGSDYYPFGLVMDGRQISDEAYRYGYQGQYSEKNDSTGWNEFQLRMYDARFGRWISPDPYGQFSSPYVGMGNIPHMGVDRDGGLLSPFSWGGAAIGAAVGVGLSFALGDEDHWYLYALGGAAAGGFLASDFAKVKVWGSHYDAGTHIAGDRYSDIYRTNSYKMNPPPKLVSRNVPAQVLKQTPLILRTSEKSTLNERPLPPLVEQKKPSIPAKIPESSSYYNGFRRIFHARNDDSGPTAVKIYRMYQEAQQSGSRHITIIFLNVKPTLQTKNWQKNVIDKLIQLGIDKRKIIEQISEKYPDNAPSIEPVQVRVIGK